MDICHKKRQKNALQLFVHDVRLVTDQDSSNIPPFFFIIPRLIFFIGTIQSFFSDEPELIIIDQLDALDWKTLTAIRDFLKKFMTQPKQLKGEAQPLIWFYLLHIYFLKRLNKA